MKKMKKLIAFTAALSIMASSFSVGMAQSYDDVNSSHRYYSEIEQLTTLGIIDGFDDGEFKADEKVTRAQFAKLVVGAMNQLAMAQSNSTSQFADVPVGHWANGFVAQGVQNKLINGTNAEGTTFDPDMNVTYAQAMKMLVCAAGYEQWSENAGGWPAGYLQYANNAGIGNGISDVGNDTPLTRGQCAKMLVNALSAPICKITGWTTDNGQSVALRSQMDGNNGNSYETLLTNEWKIYEVNGAVTATHASAGLQVGKVNYKIMRTKNYDNGNVIVKLSDNPHTISSVVDKTGDASALLNQYTRALIKIVDDIPEIVFIESSASNNEIDFYTTNYVSLSGLNTSSAAINIYKSANTSSTTAYKLSSTASMLVNDVEVPLTTANCLKYLKRNSNTVATLVDTPAMSGGTTDGKYDYIVVDYAAVAVVDDVLDRSGVKKIYFGNYDSSAINSSSIEIDPYDHDVDYTFTLNGGEISVDELRENDVLSIIFDPNTNGDVNASAFKRVTVSRDIVTGTVTATGNDTSSNEEYYVVNGTRYKLSGCCFDEPELGYSYTMYLDSKGRIAMLDQTSSSVSYAIVDRFFTEAGDEKVRLITKDGTKVSYALKTDATRLTMPDRSEKSLEDAMGYNKTYTDEQFPIENRIVNYSVNSSGQATLKELVSDMGSGYNVYRANNAEYNSTTNRIGSYAMSEASIILDASSYSENPSESVRVTSLDEFTDEMSYTAVFAGRRSSSDNSYPFVVVIKGDNGYSTKTQMAIYSSTQTQIVDSQKRTVLYVFKDGNSSATPVVMDDEYTNLGLTEGDAIIYKENSEGYVDDVKRITELSTEDISKSRNALYYSMTPSSIVTDEVRAINFNGEDQVSFVFGPVIKKYSGSIDIGHNIEYKDGKYQSDINGKSYSYDHDTKFYTYDGDSKRDRISEGTASSVLASYIAKQGYVDSARSIINWNHADSTVNWVIMRVVDKDVKEVLSIESYSKASATTALAPTPEPTATPEPTITPTQAPSDSTLAPLVTVAPVSEPTHEPATPEPTPECSSMEPATPEPTPECSTMNPATPEPTPTSEVKSMPTPEPTATAEPIKLPTMAPSSVSDIVGGVVPMVIPSVVPVVEPVSTPEVTAEPTQIPTEVPTATPTVAPTENPFKDVADIVHAVLIPIIRPTVEPTAEPTATPVATEIPQPTATPVPTATPQPTATPVPTETPQPTVTPVPTVVPTLKPTALPTATPKATATPVASASPSPVPKTVNTSVSVKSVIGNSIKPGFTNFNNMK